MSKHAIIIMTFSCDKPRIPAILSWHINTELFLTLTHCTMDHQLGFLLLLLSHAAHSALTPDVTLRFLPSGHVFYSGALINTWSKAMKNYMASSFHGRKVVDEYKRAEPSMIDVIKMIIPAAEKMNDISLLRFGKRQS